jgi:hypothetical protein
MSHATRLTGEIPIEPVEIAENRRVHALTMIFIPTSANPTAIIGPSRQWALPAEG